MEYLYVLFTVIGIGGLFVLSKVYQTRYGNGVKSLLKFSVWYAIGGFLFSFFVNRCRIDFALITLLLSLVVAITIGFDNVIGVVVFKYCKISLYTTFIMAGGMVIPSVVGVIFLDETMSIWRFLGIIAVLIALIIPVLEKTGGKTNKTGLILCVAVFISNGINNIVSKLHQINANALSTQGFLIWVNIWYLVLALGLSFVYLGIFEKKNKEQGSLKEKSRTTWKNILFPILLILLTAIVSATGQLFNLLAAKTVDASLLYPLITGGSMVLTAICGRIFFKEKITKYNAISLCVAVLSTILFVL